MIPEPGRIIRNATIIIRNDRIEAAGAQIAIPVGATVRSLNGAFVYAGFIESYSAAGVPGGQSKQGSFDGEDEIEKPASLNRGARYWNEAIKPEMNIANSLGIDEKSASELYKQGFCIAHVNSMDGIMRGTSALVFAKPGSANEVILKPDISQWMSFRKGSSRNAYQSALMGSIALIRQVSFDPSLIYQIVDDYGANGRAYYIWQRWTFDLIWPLVYGLPLFATLNRFIQPKLNFRKWIVLLPLFATLLDYLENIIFTLLVTLYPTEIPLLAWIGVTVSALKWFALGTAMMLVTLLPFFGLYSWVRQTLRKTS